MISLSGLSAVPGGYQSAQASLLAIAQKQAEQDAQTAYGQALQALAGQSGIPTAPQLPVTRQGLGVPIAPRQGLGVPIAPPMPRLAPQQPAPANSGVDALTAALQARGMSNVAPQVNPTTPPQAPAPARPPQAAQAPAASTAQPAQPQVNLPSAAGVQPGTLTWPAIVNAIKAANPKISPAALAGAVSSMLPLMQNEQAQQWKAIDEKRAQFEANTARQKAGAGAAGAYSDADIGDLADRVVSNDFPPPGASGASARYPSALNGKLAIELARRGFDLTAHISDWNAQQKMITAQNSPVAVRFLGAVDSARRFLDKFQQNIDIWNAPGLPTVINNTIIDQAQKGQLPGVDQKQAALIVSQYRELVSQLASVFSAGGVPSDQARKLAQEQIDLGWSAGTTDAVIEQIQGFLDQREAAIRGVQPYTPGGSPNSYARQPAAPSGPARQVTKQEYDQLSPGTHYLDPDGSEWIKR